MSPHKQPRSLFDLTVDCCINLINSACYHIERCSDNADHDYNRYAESEMQTASLKHQLMLMLPYRLFDVLCSRRTCCKYNGDPRLQLTVLMHPHMTVFRKCDIDNSIPQSFWLENLPNLKKLVVLDLRFICTDEILEVISANCLLLEDINIVSKVGICKSVFNASVLCRNVSDTGLSYVKNLKMLRKLAVDPPRNERAIRVGRFVSQIGIIDLIRHLPLLEEIKIESCDIGAALVTSTAEIAPLGLHTMKCHFISAEGLEKLLRMCPQLKELSVTNLSENNKDDILKQISICNLQLNRLSLSFFPFTDALLHMLVVKGGYLTHFSLWDVDHSITLDSVITLGRCCPNLKSLCLVTQSRCLTVPRYFNFDKIFAELTSLTIGNDNFDIDDILTFFLACSSHNLERLIVKYQKKLNIDAILLRLLEQGSLNSLRFLWLDCTLEVSKDVVIKMIKNCDRLETFTVDNQEDMSDIHEYILKNNYDFKLGSY